MMIYILTWNAGMGDFQLEAFKTEELRAERKRELSKFAMCNEYDVELQG